MIFRAHDSFSECYHIIVMCENELQCMHILIIYVFIGNNIIMVPKKNISVSGLLIIDNRKPTEQGN